MERTTDTEHSQDRETAERGPLTGSAETAERGAKVSRAEHAVARPSSPTSRRHNTECRAEALNLQSSQILIAVSAGSDSVALARLLARYGRRVTTRENLRFIHFNHGWRGAEADADAGWVRALGKRWNVPTRIVSLKKHLKREAWGRSLEEAARAARAQALEREAQRLEKRHGRPVWILTAHHADDVAETLLWRLFTGAAATHGGGILAREGRVLRPLLRVRKQELRAFLEEERLSWREDRTNSEGRNLRSRMRLGLMPQVEALFPRAVGHLVEAASRAQARRDDAPSASLSVSRPSESVAASRGNAGAARRPDSGVVVDVEPNAGPDTQAARIFQALNIRRPRRAHWEVLKFALRNSDKAKGEKREWHLPGGWRLVRREDL